MKKILTLAVIGLIAGTLAACSSSEPKRPYYTYQNYPVTNLNVASIQVVEQYRSPSASPNVEHLMPQPLPSAVAEWARTRFKATGTGGMMTITIKDASMVGKDLPRTTGIKGVFTVDQSQRYDGNVLVEFSAQTATGTTGGGVVHVSRGSTISEDTSLQGREEAWNTIAQGLLNDLDAQTQKMLQDRMRFIGQ